MEENMINESFNIMPEDIEIWYFIEYEIKRAMNLYGFKEVRTPIIQSVDLYKNYFKHTRSYSKESLDKLIYKIKNADNLCLRPEGTLSILQTEISKKALEKPQKVFYQGIMFRKDVQKQFYQVGVEIFGTDNIISDIEILQLATKVFSSFGLTNVSLEINSHGCIKCYPKYIKKLKRFLDLNPGGLCLDCETGTKKYPLNIYKCDENICMDYGRMAPKSIDNLCPECLENFKSHKKILSNLGISFTVNPYLIMHYDYYTRIVFNFSVKDDDKRKTIIALGGRFDSLAKHITKLPLSAVGLSFNIEDVINVMKNRKAMPRSRKVFSVCIFAVAHSMDLMILQVANELHSNEICAIIEANIVSRDQINDFIKNNKHNVYLVFREDLIREGKLMMITNDLNQDKITQDTMYLSDIMENIKRTKRQVNL